MEEVFIGTAHCTQTRYPGSATYEPRMGPLTSLPSFYAMRIRSETSTHNMGLSAIRYSPSPSFLLTLRHSALLRTYQAHGCRSRERQIAFVFEGCFGKRGCVSLLPSWRRASMRNPFLCALARAPLCFAKISAWAACTPDENTFRRAICCDLDVHRLGARYK
jgi:hypothetical protein